MKKSFTVILCLCLLAICASAQKRPDGFSQKEWNALTPANRAKIVALINAYSVERAVRSGKDVQEDEAVNFTLARPKTGGTRYQPPKTNRTMPPESNYVYHRWCDQDDVNAVYVSPYMFKMIQTLPDLEFRGRKFNLSSVIEDLSGLYMLEFAQYTQDGRFSYSRNSTTGGLRRDIRDYLDDNHYQTLVENHAGGRYNRIFIRRDGATVSGFVLVDLDEDFDYGRFICLEGRIPQAQFEKIFVGAMK